MISFFVIFFRTDLPQFLHNLMKQSTDELDKGVMNVHCMVCSMHSTLKSILYQIKSVNIPYNKLVGYMLHVRKV